METNETLICILNTRRQNWWNKARAMCNTSFASCSYRNCSKKLCICISWCLFFHSTASLCFSDNSKFLLNFMKYPLNNNMIKLELNTSISECQTPKQKIIIIKKEFNYSVLQKKDIFIPCEDSHWVASWAELLPSRFILFLAIWLCSLGPDVTPVQPKHTGQMCTPSACYYTAKYSIIFLLHCLFRHILSLQNKPRHFHNSLNPVYYARSLMAGAYRRKPVFSLYSNTIPCTAWKRAC